MDYLASMYIDNELNLEEKIRFVDRIQGDPPFYQDTRELLLQEKLLRTAPDTSMIPDHPPRGARNRRLAYKIFETSYLCHRWVCIGRFAFICFCDEPG